jgi:hypothetical protein
MVYLALRLSLLSRNQWLTLGALILVAGNAWATSWAITAFMVGYRSLEIYSVAALGHFGWLLVLFQYVKELTKQQEKK